MKSWFRLSRIVAVSTVLSLPAFLSAKDRGVDDLTISWTSDANGFHNDLVWDAIEPASTATLLNPVYYKIYAMAGYQTSTATVVAGAVSPFPFSTQQTSAQLFGTGVYSIVVVGTDTSVSPNYYDASPVRYTHFIHNSLSPVSQDIARFDTGNSQNGLGQQWRFEYKLQDDAYVSIAIYPPGTAFYKDALGFSTATVGGVAPVKTVIDRVPRSQQMIGDVFKNSDFWDLRNSSGAIVTKGVYQALITAYDKEFVPSASSIMDTLVVPVPVDSIRLYNITASALTDANTSSQIGFTVNADCRVKVIVCSPGSKFQIASAAGTLPYGTTTYTFSAGDAIPLDPVTLSTDSTRLLRVLDFNVVSGDQVLAWNGADQAGNVQNSGLYAFAITAEDAFGNHAVDLTGNNYAQFGTIAVNRSATQPSPVIFASLGVGPSTFRAPVARVAAALAYTMDGVSVDGARSSVLLTGPDHMPVAGSHSWDAAARRFDFTPSEPLTEPGFYGVEVTARGTVLARGPFSATMQKAFALQAPAVLSDAYVSPSPVKNVSQAAFHFSLASPGEVKLAIYDVLGGRVRQASGAFPAGPSSWPWDLRDDSGRRLASGVYSYELEAEGQKLVKKFILIQ